LPGGDTREISNQHAESKLPSPRFLANEIDLKQVPERLKLRTDTLTLLLLITSALASLESGANCQIGSASRLSPRPRVRPLSEEQPSAFEREDDNKRRPTDCDDSIRPGRAGPQEI
jgi:hypothetical protein